MPVELVPVVAGGDNLYAAMLAADRGIVLMPWEFANAREAAAAAADSSSASSV
jgi:hypothetical protein